MLNPMPAPNPRWLGLRQIVFPAMRSTSGELVKPFSQRIDMRTVSHPFPSTMLAIQGEPMPSDGWNCYPADMEAVEAELESLRNADAEIRCNVCGDITEGVMFCGCRIFACPDCVANEIARMQ